MLEFFFFAVLLNLLVISRLAHAQAYCAPINNVVIDEPPLDGFESFESPSASDCCSQCLMNLHCAGYTWINQQCTLMKSAKKFYYDVNATSGLRTGALLSVPGNFIFTNTSGVDSLQLLGSAAIEEEPILMLNNDDTQSAAIQLQPVQLLRDSSNVCEQASFSASFSFQIDYASDGFSFLVMGLDSSYLDLGKGYMGWSTDNFVKGGMIAIEYDTKYNSEYNDPSGSHLGINLNFNPSSVATFNTQQTGLNLSDNSVKYSWIDYDAASKKLNVFLDTTNVKPSLPLLAYNVSLCSALRPPTCAGCFSTTAAYFGFTLSSSEEFQRINILTWQFSTQWPTSQIGTNPPSGKCSILPGIRFNGYSIDTPNKIYGAAPEECCSICSNMQRCLGFSWNKLKYCDLFYHLTDAVYSSDSISGEIYPRMRYTPMRISLPTFNSYSPMYLFGASQLAGNSIKMNFMPWQVGHAFLSNPIQLLRDSNTSCQSATFNVSFAFNVQNGTNPLADGFTFQIVSSNTPLGRRSHGDNAGGNLGLRLGGDVVRPGMIAVEFDNYNNGYENGDLDDNHVAVDVDFTQYSVYSINANSFKIDLRDGKPKNSWIDYDGFTNILRVFLSYSSSKPSKPILAYPINLCQVLRPEHFLSSKTVTSAYFGFSGATGGAYQSTDVWKFSLSTTWATSSTPKPGTLFQPSLRPTSTIPKYLNKFFRYASAGYLSQSQNLGHPPTWLVATSWNWALDLAKPVKDSKDCSSCYAMATTEVLESSYFLTNYNLSTSNWTFSAPDLSEQQIIDCQSPGKCLGGWPVDSLDYSVSTGLVEEANYPYLSKNGTCLLPNAIPFQVFKPTSFEKVDFYGWFGLLLAVMQQPVLVHVEANSPSFLNYGGGIYGDTQCYQNGVNHNMVLVGYNIVNQPPFWILKNAWGSRWGENGYMRMAIQSGDGICGINTMPGYIPIFKPRDPCNLSNYPSLSGVTTNRVDSAPGRLNPCGGGVCTVVGNTNNCTCPYDFLPAKNSDGSETCVPSSPCTFMLENPCNIGTCVDSLSSPGTYTCICPIGYQVGVKASDNSTTCIPAALSGGVQTYVIPAGFNLTCPLIYQLYGIEKSKFLGQNTANKLNCNSSLPSGTVVNVTNSYLDGCKLPYAINKGDTCDKIQDLFNISALAGANSPNPDLDCSTLQLGQQVCIIRRSANDTAPPDLPLCTAYYTTSPSDTCSTVIANKFGGMASKFFSLNPGLYCSNFNKETISNVTLVGQEVCIASTTFGTIKEGCTKKFVTTSLGDTCPYIFGKYFCGSSGLFRSLNKGVSCRTRKLLVSKVGGKSLGFCAPTSCP